MEPNRYINLLVNPIKINQNNINAMVLVSMSHMGPAYSILFLELHSNSKLLSVKHPVTWNDHIWVSFRVLKPYSDTHLLSALGGS